MLMVIGILGYMAMAQTGAALDEMQVALDAVSVTDDTVISRGVTPGEDVGGTGNVEGGAVEVVAAPVKTGPIVDKVAV